MQIDFLAIGAHPDDIELGCGGTLIKLAQQGYKTAALTLTLGESGTRGTTEIRKQEFDRAARIMHLSYHNMLDIPDAGIEETQYNKIKIVRVIRELKPRVIATMHWQARHPDHIHTSRLVRDAAMIAGLKNLNMNIVSPGSSELPSAENKSEWQEPWRPFRVLYFPERFNVPISFIVDITDTFEERAKAVFAHESQFYNKNMGKYGLEKTPITRPEFLEYIETKNRHWGDMIGVKYGEAFFVRETIKLDDPVAAFGEWCANTIP